MPAPGATFEAVLDQNNISLGDTATLTLTVTDGSVSSEPTLPPINGLEVHSTGTQKEVNIENFHMVQKSIYTFELSPTTIGNFTIPALQAGVDGQPMFSKPLRLTVTRGRAAAAPGSGPAFVELSIPKTNLYFGEIVRVEIKCYFQSAGTIQQPTLSSDGFSDSQIINPDTRLTPPREVIGGVPYYVFTFPLAITATKTGRLTLGPATWELNVPTGPANIFGQRRQQHISVSSDSISINVKSVPVPPNVTAFSGAVGNFTLAEFDASPTSVGVGDPITLKVRINGRGGFDNLVLPTNQPGWNDFKAYQPTGKFESSDPLQIEGSKYFEQVVTPLNASIKEIPAFLFTFFDPQRKSFRSLTHPPIAITVKPTAATPQPTVISTGAPPPEEPQSREIVHIKPFFGHALPNRPALVMQPWFLALQAVPPLGWIAALIWRRRKDSLANNPRLRRQRQVARIVQEGLAELAGLASSNDYDRFYAGVFRLLQEQLGERLDLPASAITEAALESLPRHHLDDGAFKTLQELFQACNQYRYTPEHTAQEMNSIIAKLKEALDALQRMKSRPGSGKRVAAALGGLLLLALTQSLSAQPAIDAFSQANKLYEEGKYPAAADAWQKLIATGHRSVAAYFNLGNACYKSGQIGKAIEAYRRAEEFDPRDPDIRANLRFARDQVANFTAALPGSRWTRWVGRVTLDQWAISASVTLALFFLTLIVRQLRPSRQPATWTAPILLGLAALCLIICLSLDTNQRLFQKSAIVIVSEAVARRGPLEEAQSAFTLHDGAELLVVNNDGPWVEVADASARTGWIPQKDLAFIP